MMQRCGHPTRRPWPSGSQLPCPHDTTVGEIKTEYHKHVVQKSHFAKRLVRPSRFQTQEPWHRAEPPEKRQQQHPHHSQLSAQPGPATFVPEPRHSKAWSQNLSADLAAVAAELDLPTSCGQALYRAASKQQISCNPGIIICQVLRLLPLEQQLGRGAVAAALTISPVLLNHDASTLATNLAAAAELLPQERLPGMYLRCPSLLAYTPFRIWSSLELLSQLLGCSWQEAAAVAGRRPQLLLMSLPLLRLRYDQLLGLLGCGAPGVGRLVKAAPSVLTLSPPAVAAKLQQLEVVLSPLLVHYQPRQRGRPKQRQAAQQQGDGEQEPLPLLSGANAGGRCSEEGPQLLAALQGAPLSGGGGEEGEGFREAGQVGGGPAGTPAARPGAAAKTEQQQTGGPAVKGAAAAVPGGRGSDPGPGAPCPVQAAGHTPDEGPGQGGRHPLCEANACSAPTAMQLIAAGAAGRVPRSSSGRSLPISQAVARAAAAGGARGARKAAATAATAHHCSCGSRKTACQCGAADGWVSRPFLLPKQQPEHTWQGQQQQQQRRWQHQQQQEQQQKCTLQREHRRPLGQQQQQQQQAVVPSPSVQQLLARVPTLITCDCTDLPRRISQLGQLLQLPAPQLSQLLLRQPQLLVLAPAAVAAKAELLQQLTGQPRGWVGRLFSSNPAVLTLSPDRLQGHWGLLGRLLTGLADDWEAQVKGGSPSVLAFLLCCSERRLKRLDFLKAVMGEHSGAGGAAGSISGSNHMGSTTEGPQDSNRSSSSSRRNGILAEAGGANGRGRRGQTSGGLPWRRLLMLSDAAFIERFPPYQDWQQQQEQQ